jgi:hypothetical protein
MINSWMVATGLQQAKVEERAPSIIREFKPKHVYRKKNAEYWASKSKRESPKAKKVVALFKAGLDLRQICEQEDVSRNWARNTLLKHGLVEKERKGCVKPIIVCKLDGEFVGEYIGCPATALATGVSESLVRKCVAHVKESGKGFTFKYKRDVVGK